MTKLSTNNKLSIIIVNFNSTSFLNTLLKSLLYISQLVGEIIIVDNNSYDFYKIRPIQKRKTRLIRNTNNIGFSKAVNQAIQITKHDYILLINPDTRITKDNYISKIFQAIINDHHIGAIGGKIISKNQKYTANTKPNFLTGLFEFTNIKKIIPNNPFSNHFWPEKKLKIHNQTEVDGLCGAFIIFRKYHKNQLNLFDENYFLYLEDLDFCLNLKKLGYKIIFDPKSKIIHKGGVSSKSKYNVVLKNWYKSRRYFFRKHLGKIKGNILSLIFSAEELLLRLYHHLRHEPAE